MFLTVMPTQKFKFHLAYRGSNYSGFQVQPKKITVQSILEQTLQKVLQEKIKVTASGRTDTGVHAIEQIFHIEVKSQKALQRLKRKDILYSLNSVLPDDILINQLQKVTNSFHAQKSAKEKTYTYFLLLSKYKNPFLEDYVWRLNMDLDLVSMQKAAKHIVGKHDFSSFCASDSCAKGKTREIKNINITSKCPAPFFRFKNEKYIQIEITGTGFLKQMVRNIVGTLVEVGQNKRQSVDVKKILKAKDRKKAGITAPAKGLFLKRVRY